MDYSLGAFQFRSVKENRMENSINLCKAAELLAKGKYPDNQVDRLSFEVGLLHGEITRLAYLLNLRAEAPISSARFVKVTFQDAEMWVTGDFGGGQSGSDEDPPMPTYFKATGIYIGGFNCISFIDEIAIGYIENLVIDELERA